MIDGRIRQKRIEIILSQLNPFTRPKLELEEYTLDSKSAARMLYMAGMVYDDIVDKQVVDLGCGTGVLAIGAAFVGAKFVVGIDIDEESISIARENTEKVGVEVDYIVGDIESIFYRFDTTLMNPPFGCWNRGMDINFLRNAIKVSEIIYSIHKRGEKNRAFLNKKIESFGGRVENVFELDITIPRTYKFHRKRKYRIKADLYRIKRIDLN